MITAPKITTQPINDLIFQGARKWKYVPKPDITVYELALLSKMFMFASNQKGFFVYDFDTYIIENSLTRHFETDDV